MRYLCLALGALFVVGAVVPEARAQDAGQLTPVEPGKAPELPAPGAAGDTNAAAVSSATPASGSTADVSSGSVRDPYKLDDLTVTGEALRAASANQVRAEEFMQRPLREPSDLLRLIPGLWTSQHQGGGKADQIFLRGFDCDHGDNIEIDWEGVPSNLRSHAHGQGYADQHGIIPEMVDSVEFSKGPYYAELGDFDTAGALRYVFRDELPGDERIQYKQEGGSFDTSREMLAISPIKTDSTHTVIAGEAYYTNSFPDHPSDYLRLNLFAKATEYLSNNLELSWWVTILKSSWESPGQVPVQAIQEGMIGRFGSLDHTEGGETSRTNSQVQLRWTPDAEDIVQVRIWGAQETLRMYHDFHYYTLSDGLGPLPEGIMEIDQRWLTGGDAKFVHTQKIADVETKVTVGVQTRTDLIDVALDQQIHRHEVDSLVNDHVVESSVSEYAEVEVQPVKGLRVIGGVRGDEFNYTVTDLGHALDHVQGQKNDSVPQGKGSIVLGPFTSTDPVSSTELFFNVGSGFHTNDARVVVQNPHGVTLPIEVAYEAGAHTHAFDRLDVALDFFVIDLQQELTYNQDQGVVTPSGATRRVGVEMEYKLKIVPDWLWVEEDLVFCEGRFTNVNDSPVPGQDRIPQAPRLMSTTRLRFQTPIGLEGEASALLIGRRPLDDDVTETHTQFTVNVLLKWIPQFDGWKDHVDVFCRIENLFNVNWNEAEFVNYYQLKGQAAPVTGHTIVPGSPFAVYGGIEIKW